MSDKLYAYGYAQYNVGNWKEAVDTFSVLCQSKPLEAEYWFALGASKLAAGEYKEALYPWAMAALLNKEDPYPHFHAAECCFSLSLPQDGALALKEAEERLTQDHPLVEKIKTLKQQWSL